MKRILITGGLGYVGGRLTKKLATHHHVIASSRNIQKKATLSLYGNVDLIAHHHLLDTETFPNNIETVIHLAALNEWDCLKNPSEAIKVNIDETRIILENAIGHGVNNFIYLSTAHVYGSPLTGTITEEKLPAPVHPYAITHKAAEDYVLAATRQNKIHSIVLRLSNAFGAPVDPQVNRWTLLTNDLSRQAVKKNSLALLSNGCQYRDFITLTDVAMVINEIVKDPQRFNKRIYNLGSGRSMRVLDMAKAIQDAFRIAFGKTIPLVLPEDSKETTEPGLFYSIERLTLEKIKVENAIQRELVQLLKFCHAHFANKRFGTG